ncbi:MAG: tetratricopeptide repeat protein [Alphaproteobacteria bacterium]|nr:tetratricopeptide repeat protein [Alphaproteobacteria bacterium]
MIVALWTLMAVAGAPDTWQQSYDEEARGAFVEALASHERLPSADQGTYTWQLRKAWLLYLQGRYDESTTAYERAVGMAPKAVEPLLGEMLPLLAARRWADAERVGRKVLALDPKSALGRMRTGLALHNLGRYADAEALYRSVVEDWPSDVDARAGLGWAQLKLGRVEEAKRTFDAVLGVAPRHASAQAGRAACSE